MPSDKFNLRTECGGEYLNPRQRKLKLRNEQFLNLYFLLNINRVIKSTWITGTKHTECTRQIINARGLGLQSFDILVGKRDG
jgi:hypothetical protein